MFAIMCGSATVLLVAILVAVILMVGEWRGQCGVSADVADLDANMARPRRDLSDVARQVT
jgi:hypothetical protein